MNCIDAVEGALKSAIDHLQKQGSRHPQDATQFIRSVQAVIESADTFIGRHPEITPSPDVLRHVLYDFAKQLWVAEQVPSPSAAGDPPPEADMAEYYEYCFDYLYANGVYPP